MSKQRHCLTAEYMKRGPTAPRPSHFTRLPAPTLPLTRHRLPVHQHVVLPEVPAAGAHHHDGALALC